MARPAEDDPLEALRVRLEATQDAVDRLAAEAREARTGAATGAGPQAPPPSGEQAAGEVQALAALVEMLRGLLPAELQAQLTELIRQVLLLVRAILDWWIERIDVPPEAPGADVQDIEVR